MSSCAEWSLSLLCGSCNSPPRPPLRLLDDVEGVCADASTCAAGQSAQNRGAQIQAPRPDPGTSAEQALISSNVFSSKSIDCRPAIADSCVPCRWPRIDAGLPLTKSTRSREEGRAGWSPNHRRQPRTSHRVRQRRIGRRARGGDTAAQILGGIVHNTNSSHQRQHTIKGRSNLESIRCCCRRPPLLTPQQRAPRSRCPAPRPLRPRAHRQSRARS